MEENITVRGVACVALESSFSRRVAPLARVVRGRRVDSPRRESTVVAWKEKQTQKTNVTQLDSTIHHLLFFGHVLCASHTNLCSAENIDEAGPCWGRTVVECCFGSSRCWNSNDNPDCVWCHEGEKKMLTTKILVSVQDRGKNLVQADLEQVSRE